MSTARLPRSRSAKLQGPPAPRRRPHMRPQEPPRHGSTRLAAHVPIRPRTFRVVLCVVRRRRATAWRDAGDAHGCGAARIGCGRSSSRPTTRLARAHAVVVSRSALGSQVTRLTSAQRGLSPKQTAGRESVPAEQAIERGKALSATPPPENKWTRDVIVAPSQAVYESVHVPAGQRGQACSATVDRRPRTITSRLGLGSCLRPHTRLEDGNFLVMLDGRRLSRRTHHRRHRSPGAETLPPHRRRHPKSPAQAQSSRERERGQGQRGCRTSLSRRSYRQLGPAGAPGRQVPETCGASGALSWHRARARAFAKADLGSALLCYFGVATVIGQVQ